jgi:hypothetical protein
MLGWVELLIVAIGVADPGSDMRLAFLSAGPLETKAITLPYHRNSFRQRFGLAAGQGRKADTARDRGLSALPSSAPTDAVRQSRFGPLPQGAAVLASGVPCFRGPVRRRHPFPAPRKHESPRGSHAFAAALKAGRFGKQAAKAWHTSYTPWGDGGWAEPGRGRGGNRRGRRTA